MNKILKHPIVATVVGGLLLSLIFWLVGFFPTLWLWIKTSLIYIWELFTLTLSTPVWLILLLVIVGLPIYWRIGVKTLSHIFPSNRQNNEETDSIVSHEPEQLTENEYLVLRALASANGGSLRIDSIANNINQNQLRTEQAIESLVNHDYVKRSLNYVYGTSYRLSSYGRDIAIELGYA